VGKAVGKITTGMQYPDYMERDKGVTFESTTAIGKIWREARSCAHEVAANACGWGLDARLLLPGRAVYARTALEHAQWYTRDLGRLMSAYGTHDEGEVMVGRVARFHHGPQVCASSLRFGAVACVQLPCGLRATASASSQRVTHEPTSGS
jgi:hypothetical protein